MSYRDDALRLPNGMSAAMIKAGAAGIAARADARIAELEREIERLDAQWREELRIYREADDARIAELEADAGHLRTFARLRFGYAPGDYFGTCHHCAKEFIGDKRAMNCEACADAAIDAARANGGGE